MKHDFPARPSLTPIFTCSLVFWVMCALAYSTGAGRSVSGSVSLLGAGALCSVAGVCLAFACKKRLAGIVLAAAGVGLCLGVSHAMFVHMQAESFEGRSGEFEFELLEDSSSGMYGETALVRARMSDGREATLNARFKESAPLLAGERFRGQASFKAPDYEKSPYAWSDGASGNLSVASFERVVGFGPVDALVDVRRTAIESIGSQDDAHRLLQALVCGYRREIRGTDLYAAFQTCGLAHLVAVSGAHLVIVVGLFASLLKALRAPRKLSIALLIAVMGSYFVLAGMPVSALRATIMSALGLLSFFGGRRASSLNSVGIGVFVILAANPSACLSASFVLSGLSTAGIVLFAPLFQFWLDRTPFMHLGFVVEALSLTGSASVLSQPYACSLFGVLPVVSPLANIVAGPFFPLVCSVGLIRAFVGVVFPVGASALDIVTSGVAQALLVLVGLLASIPHASIPVFLSTTAALGGSALLASVIWAWWPHSIGKTAACAGAVAFALLVAFVVIPDNRDTITALDVGQGDALLVRSRGATMLVDTGNQDAELLEQLGMNRIHHIDTVLISHADDDHCGSLDALKRAVTVDRVLVASGMASCSAASARSLVSEAQELADDVVEISYGDTFAIGAFHVRFVWPEKPVVDGGNADSLCALLEYDGDDDGAIDCTALMTGDAEKDELKRMIESGAVGAIDILKVGHHGSRNGSTPDEMATLHPAIALISCGAHNRYGHPTQEILDMLDDVGAKTFRTDTDGQIRCVFSPSSVTVECER